MPLSKKRNRERMKLLRDVQPSVQPSVQPVQPMQPVRLICPSIILFSKDYDPVLDTLMEQLT